MFDYFKLICIKIGKVPKEEVMTMNCETGLPKFHVSWRLGHVRNGASAKGYFSEGELT